MNNPLFTNKYFGGRGGQDNCYEYFDNDESKFYVAFEREYKTDDELVKYSNCYYAYDDYDNFMIDFSTIGILSQRRFYEQIKGLCYEHWDLDVKISESKFKNTRDLLRAFLELRCKLTGKFLPNASLDEFFITTSSNDKKLSAHIVYKGHKFNSNLEHKVFAEKFNTLCNEEQIDIGLDVGIYTKNRNFRMVHNTKAGQERPLIYYNHPGEKHQITHPDYNIPYILKRYITHINPNQPKPINPNQPKPINPNQPINHNHDTIKNMIESVDKEKFVNGKRSDWMLFLFALKYFGFSDIEIHTISQLSPDIYNYQSCQTVLDSYNVTKCSWNVESFINTFIQKDKRKELLKTIKSKTNEIKKYPVLSGTHDAINTFFREKEGHNYKTSSKYDFIYRWDDNTKLWQEKTIESCQYDIRKLIPYVLEFDVENEVKTFIKHRLEEVNTIQKAFKLVICDSYDEGFFNIINKSKEEIPILHGRKINLQTGLITMRDRSDLFSFEMKIIGEVDTMEVETYMNELFDNDTEKIHYIHKLCGYFLTGHIRERGIYMFLGNGSNGKTFFVNLLKKLMTEFYSSVLRTTFIESLSHHAEDARPTPELEPFINARMVVLEETGKLDRLNVNRVKQVTGGGTIVHRPMYMRGKPIQIETHAKPCIVSNNILQMDITDQAILNRIKVIKFNHKFKNPVESDITQITRIAFLESDEFLYAFGFWCVLGAGYYLNGGVLIEPSCVQASIQDYINDLDFLAQFIIECCDIDPEFKQKTDDLWMAFYDFSQGTDEKINKMLFGKNILAKGYSKKRITTNNSSKYYYIGIKLKIDPDPFNIY